MYAEAPLLAGRKLDKMLDTVRGNGWKTIVFTNGVFDLFHVGHDHLLRQIHDLFEGKEIWLIIGVNSDASVKAWGKRGRPICDERARARILQSHICVDAVTIFNEADPLGLIKRIRPDVLVKGGDYTMDEIVGRAEVESWGGSVMIIDALEHDYGRTSKIISKLSQLKE
jgi:D-beta-D-heptose 7-phosphate kinase/D-beta-D-heptose 1-phosphate adenosyltransferase